MDKPKETMVILKTDNSQTRTKLEGGQTKEAPPIEFAAYENGRNQAPPVPARKDQGTDSKYENT